MARTLTVPERHQLRIPRDTLKMTPAMAAVMGGPNPEEARRTIRQLTGCAIGVEKEATLFDLVYVKMAQPGVCAECAKLHDWEPKEIRGAVVAHGTERVAILCAGNAHYDALFCQLHYGQRLQRGRLDGTIADERVSS